ncbi:hypothetical protein FKP32DRAFT_301858 [Trametes sanguinea]|nr:hypothetical protein FKP32DRAFT_301858 [Trametes sanguinea]
MGWPTPQHPMDRYGMRHKVADIAVSADLRTSFLHPSITNLLARAFRKSPSPWGRLRPTALSRQSVSERRNVPCIRRAVDEGATATGSSLGNPRRPVRVGSSSPWNVQDRAKPARASCTPQTGIPCLREARDRHARTHNVLSAGPVLVGTASRTEWATRTLGTSLITRRRGQSVEARTEVRVGTAVCAQLE